jgi:hypothetical protein
MTSTISIAEYCVKGKLEELPLENLQLIPFNTNHAEKAGKLAYIIFQNRGVLELTDRKIIPNDTKLFAQADTEQKIDRFATADEASIKVFNLLNSTEKLSFDILNIRAPYHETFGILDFP